MATFEERMQAAFNEGGGELVADSFEARMQAAFAETLAPPRPGKSKSAPRVRARARPSTKPTDLDSLLPPPTLEQLLNVPTHPALESQVVGIPQPGYAPRVPVPPTSLRSRLGDTRLAIGGGYRPPDPNAPPPEEIAAAARYSYTQPQVPRNPYAAAPVMATDILRDIGAAGLHAGVRTDVNLAKLAGNLGLNTGRYVEETEALLRNDPNLQARTFTSGPGAKLFQAASESVGPSILTGALAAPLGPLGMLAAPGLMFGGAEYYDFGKDLEKAGIDPRSQRGRRILSALSEAGFEIVGDIGPGKALGIIAPGLKKAAAKGALAFAKKLVKSFVTSASTEVPSEVATAYAQNALRQGAGINTGQTSLEAGLSAVEPTLYSSALFGGIGAVSNRRGVTDKGAQLQLEAARATRAYYNERVRLLTKHGVATEAELAAKAPKGVVARLQRLSARATAAQEAYAPFVPPETPSTSGVAPENAPQAAETAPVEPIPVSGPIAQTEAPVPQETAPEQVAAPEEMPVPPQVPELTPESLELLNFVEEEETAPQPAPPVEAPAQAPEAPVSPVEVSTATEKLPGETIPKDDDALVLSQLTESPQHHSILAKKSGLSVTRTVEALARLQDADKARRQPNNTYRIYLPQDPPIKKYDEVKWVPAPMKPKATPKTQAPAATPQPLTRESFRARVREVRPNITEEQVDAALFTAETMAKERGLTLDEAVGKMFSRVEGEGTPGEGALQQYGGTRNERLKAQPQPLGGSFNDPEHGERYVSQYNPATGYWEVIDTAVEPSRTKIAPPGYTIEARPYNWRVAFPDGTVKYAGTQEGASTIAFAAEGQKYDKWAIDTTSDREAIARAPKREDAIRKAHRILTARGDAPSWTVENALLYQGPKGAYDPTTRVLYLLKGADISTVLHEVFHAYHANLMSAEDDATLQKLLGAKDGKWNKAQRERGARLFERYLRDGKAPNAEVKAVFAKISAWLKGIYKTLKGSDIEEKVSPEVRAFFDKLMGGRGVERTRGKDAGQGDILFQLSPEDRARLKTVSQLKPYGGSVTINNKEIARSDVGFNVIEEGVYGKRVVSFPSARLAVDYANGTINGLVFHAPTVSNEMVPVVKESADYKGQFEQWTERSTGDEVLTKPLIGWHYSGDPIREFVAKETAFFKQFKKNIVKEGHGYLVIIPPGKRVVYYDDEFRVNLDDDAVVYKLSGGWNRHDTIPGNDKGTRGHKQITVNDSNAQEEIGPAYKTVQSMLQKNRVISGKDILFQLSPEDRARREKGLRDLYDSGQVTLDTPMGDWTRAYLTKYAASKAAKPKPKPKAAAKAPAPTVEPSKPKVPGRLESGQHASIERLAADLSFDIAEKDPQKVQAILDRAKAEGADSDSAVSLAIADVGKGKGLTPEQQAGMLMNANDIVGDLPGLEKAVEQARAKGGETLRNAQAAHEDKLIRLAELANAYYKGRSNVGRELFFGRVLITSEWSFAGLTGKAQKKKGKALTPEETERFAAFTAEIEQLKKTIEELRAEQAESRAGKTVDPQVKTRAQREINKIARQSRGYNVKNLEKHSSQIINSLRRKGIAVNSVLFQGGEALDLSLDDLAELHALSEDYIRLAAAKEGKVITYDELAAKFNALIDDLTPLQIAEIILGPEVTRTPLTPERALAAEARAALHEDARQVLGKMPEDRKKPARDEAKVNRRLDRNARKRQVKIDILNERKLEEKEWRRVFREIMRSLRADDRARGKVNSFDALFEQMKQKIPGLTILEFSRGVTDKKPPKTYEEAELLLRIQDDDFKATARLAIAMLEPRTTVDYILGAERAVNNFMRTMVAGSVDIGYALLQGKRPAFTHNAQWRKAFLSSLKALGNDRTARAIDIAIRDSPNFAERTRFGIKPRSWFEPHGERVEYYGGTFASRLPNVRATERAMTTFLNLLQAEMYDQNKLMLEAMGATDTATLQAMAKEVNLATGTRLGQKSGWGDHFFAPNWFLSQLHLPLYKAHYIGSALSHSEKRALASIFIKQWLKGMLGLGMAYFLAWVFGARLHLTDWLDKDFGKIQIGKIRVDPLGPEMQVARIGVRNLWGEQHTYNSFGIPKKSKPNLYMDLARFTRYKLSPIRGLQYDILNNQTDPFGRPILDPRSLAERITPMLIWTAVDGYEDGGAAEALLTGAASSVGAKISVYNRNIERKRRDY